MEEIDVVATVRVCVKGEYIDTETFNLSIPNDTTEDDLVEVMMKQVNEFMFDTYGDMDEWEDGEVSWTLTNWI